MYNVLVYVEAIKEYLVVDGEFSSYEEAENYAISLKCQRWAVEQIPANEVAQ